MEIINKKSPKTAAAAAPSVPAAPVSSGPEAYVPSLNPIYRVEAEWPESAKQKAIQGTVDVLVTLSPQGLVSAAEALTGPETLRQAAIDAVVEYLTLCRKFWTMGASKLDAWINNIRSGGKPDFGPNLVY